MAEGLVLFGAPDPPEPEQPPESQTVRRTRRQAAMLAAGIHPLSAVAGKLRVHPEAAPYGDLQAPGRRCGNCTFRQVFSHHNDRHPKCTVADGARVSHSAATDCRAWWPGCVNHEQKKEETDD
ncbi:hypothetical protein [Streptosporangium sp. NPDC020145]|uniref:hypothetical protein n=1 Tax=Streptosporangium sp. NPDC020145 TaxID=3154694 RepID=UPI003434579A